MPDKPKRWKVAEHVHGENEAPSGRVEFDYRPGIHTAENADDAFILDHLAELGFATVEDEPRRKAASDADDTKAGEG